MPKINGRANDGNSVMRTPTKAIPFGIAFGLCFSVTEGAN